MSAAPPQLKSGLKIHRLGNDLINQIAAGEVVERPASIVKELVENSLDAESRRVEVRIREGGTEEISVTDDGSGIAPEDLELALERHATSKILAAGDLESIRTYGFRGEALSSISSIADVQIRSRTRESETGFQIEMSFGGTPAPRTPLGTAPGTSVIVRNIFARTPARLKFLRSVPTEFSHSAKIFRELALGSPGTQFFLHHQGQLVSSYVAQDRRGRFDEVIRPKWKPLHGLEETPDMRLEVFLSPTSLIQSKGELFLFVNGRSVRNRSILSAIRSTYLDALGPGHDPSGVIFLDMRFDWVDVNVHPQKLDVRCLRQESLYPWLRSFTRKLISQNPEARPIDPDLFEPSKSPVPLSRLSEPEARYTPRTASAAVPEPDYTTRPVQKEAEPRAQARPRLKYLGQVKASYLVCEDEEGVALVDQHALHEKMRFEELRARFSQQGLTSQRLLVPKVARLPADLIPVLQEHLSAFERMGFEIEDFGDGDVAIKGLPDIIDEGLVETVLIESLERVRDAQSSPEEALERVTRPVFATVACHSVVRANQQLSLREAESLLQGLDRLNQGWTCPHGRPVVFRLSFQSIAKHFERT